MEEEYNLKEDLEKWAEIEKVEYNPGKIDLYHDYVQKIHDVRCVDATGMPKTPEYQCKFENGHGILGEGFDTKYLVEMGEWYWEIKLKPGDIH